MCKALRAICKILMPHMSPKDDLTYIFSSMEALVDTVLGNSTKR